MRRLIFFVILGISTIASADEQLDCNSSQDAFTNAVCSKYHTELKASIALIASTIAPGKPVMPWIKSIAGNCKDDTDCIGRELLLEWLKFSANATDYSKNTPVNKEGVCQDFNTLLTEELIRGNNQTQNFSPANPQRSIGFNVSAEGIRNAYEQANLTLPSEESLPYGMSSDVNRTAQVYPLINGGSFQTGFIIYDGGTLYCHSVNVAVIEKNTRNVKFLDGNPQNNCLNEEGNFFTQKKHNFPVKRSPLIDGAQYEVFVVKEDVSEALCTVKGKMKLDYSVNTKHCSLSNPACELVNKEAIKLAKYFDSHPKIVLGYEKTNVNGEEHQLMPNTLKEDLPKYGYASSPSNLDIPQEQLTDAGFQIGKYASFRPWQSFRVNNKKYLLSIIDGEYDFEGYIFYLEEQVDGDYQLDGSSGLLITVRREMTPPVSIAISYPESPQN